MAGKKLIWGIILYVTLPYSLFSQYTVSYDTLLQERDLVLLRENTNIQQKSYRAELMVYKSIDETMKFISNPEAYKRWIGSIEEVELLSESLDKNGIYRILLDMNSIFKREGILKTRLTKVDHGVVYTVELDTANQRNLTYEPPKYVNLQWKLIRQKDEKVRVTLLFTGYTKTYGYLIDSILDKLYDMGLRKVVSDLQQVI